MKHLVTALVLARIDSCNSVLVNLPAFTIAPLQRVQNTAARLVLGLKRRAHITPALKKLHWLPVRQRITPYTDRRTWAQEMASSVQKPAGL